MNLIVIIDYKVGNIGSIVNMIKRIGYSAKVTNDHDDIKNASRIILPGVGAFDNGMKYLQLFGLTEILNHKVLSEKVPVIGMCLGMQLMTKKSEEGDIPGLGWLDAETVKFRFWSGSNSIKIPHMGWNTVRPKDYQSIFKGLEGDETRFYFAHSFHVRCRNEEEVLATSYHGIEITSAIRKGNIFGVQFHPEKSHKYGMMLLKNFLEG
jgi:glutamine amidotransferase